MYLKTTNETLKFPKESFEIKYMGSIRYCLGIDDWGIQMSQKATLDVISRFGMST